MDLIYIVSNLQTKNNQFPELQNSIITMNGNRVKTNTTQSYITICTITANTQKKKKKNLSVKLLLCMATVGEVK